MEPSLPSGRAVAAAADVPLSTVHRALAGHNVGVTVALKISRAVGRSVEDLFGHLAPPNEPLVGPTAAAPRRRRKKVATTAVEPEALDPMIEEAVAEFRARLTKLQREARAKRARAPKTVKAQRPLATKSAA